MAKKEKATEPEPEPEEIPFTLTPVESRPSRRYRKGSKYDPILEGFMKSEHDLVTVVVEGKDANYMRTQLDKRIEPMKLKGKVKVSVVNDTCYLEKIK